MIDFAFEFSRLSGQLLSGRLNVSTDLVSNFESMIGASLPEGYARFLRLFGGSKICSQCLCIQREDISTEFFFGFFDRSESASIEDDFDELGIAPDAISFAQDAYGGQFLLFLTQPMRGNVFYYDTEGEEDFLDDPAWRTSGIKLTDLGKLNSDHTGTRLFANFYYLANTFEEFFANCQPVGRH